MGFVPLIHFAASRAIGTNWSLAFDTDALAGGPGRAVDASLKVGYDLGEHWSLRAGYRTVEGGADVQSVYNFAWLHFGVLSIAWQTQPMEGTLRYDPASRQGGRRRSNKDSNLTG